MNVVVLTLELLLFLPLEEIIEEEEDDDEGLVLVLVLGESRKVTVSKFAPRVFDDEDVLEWFAVDEMIGCSPSWDVSSE